MIGLYRKTDETSQNIWRTSPVRTWIATCETINAKSPWFSNGWWRIHPGQSKIALCVDIVIQDIGLKNASHWRLWGNLVHISLVAVVGRGKILLVMAHIHPHLGDKMNRCLGAFRHCRSPKPHGRPVAFGTGDLGKLPSIAVETALFYRALIGFYTPRWLLWHYTDWGFVVLPRTLHGRFFQHKTGSGERCLLPPGLLLFLGLFGFLKGEEILLHCQQCFVHSWVHWEPKTQLQLAVTMAFHRGSEFPYIKTFEGANINKALDQLDGYGFWKHYKQA